MYTLEFRLDNKINLDLISLLHKSNFSNLFFNSCLKDEYLFLIIINKTFENEFKI